MRLGDVGPGGALRLDAIARYLQDVATDDVRDAGVADDHRWVVRRTRVEVVRRPRYEERVELSTWCSGTGAAWAERRTTIAGEHGGRVEAVSLWVSLDPATMRPVALGDRFSDVYGRAAAGRAVKARLLHALPPGTVPGRPWPLRSTDFDVLGHVNNSVAWAAVEDGLASLAPGRRLAAGEVEYREAIEAGATLRLVTQLDGDLLAVWLCDAGGAVALSARAELSPPR